MAPTPPAQLDEKPKTVDGLQPTLSWKATGGNETKYDLIICKGVEERINYFTAFYKPEKEAYYREGIEGCTHRVEQPLRPNVTYVWSVRVHTGIEGASWSTYDCQVGYLPFGLAPVQAKNMWWPFKTPGQ